MMACFLVKLENKKTEYRNTNTRMEKIKINLPLGKNQDEIKIHGFSINEILRFLCEADNGSFDRIIIKYDAVENLLFFASEEGVKFPEYGHFMTKISESRYAEVFSFSKVL